MGLRLMFSPKVYRRNQAGRRRTSRPTAVRDVRDVEVETPGSERLPRESVVPFAVATDVYQATALGQIRPDSAPPLPKIDQNVTDESIMRTRYWHLIEAEGRR